MACRQRQRVGISPAQLARLETNQRGLYVEDFVSIAEALGEKPGNLLPNDLGDIGHLKPLIDRLATVRPEFLARLATIVGKIVQLTEDVTAATPMPPQQQDGKPRRQITIGGAAKRRQTSSARARRTCDWKALRSRKRAT